MVVVLKREANLDETAENDYREFVTGNVRFIYEQYGALRIRVYDSNGTGHFSDLPASFFEGKKWYHIAFVYNASTGLYRIYKNGVLVKDYNMGTFTVADASSVRLLGSGSTLHTWDGKMDEFRIYYTALTNDQVRALYESYMDTTDATVSFQSGDKLEMQVYKDNNVVIDEEFKDLFDLNLLLDSDTTRFTSTGFKALDISGNSHLGSWEVHAAGYYPFNGDASDESVNSYDGTVVGAELVTDHVGGLSNAYSFNGTSNYIESNSNFTEISGSESRTEYAWIKLNDGAGDNDIILFYGAEATGEASCFKVYNNRLAHTFWGGSEYEVQDDTPLSTGTWYFVAFVWDDAAKEARFYVNNTLSSTHSLSSVINTNPNNKLFIGTRITKTEFADMTVSSVGIFKHPFSSDDIAELYAQTKVHKLDRPFVTKDDRQGLEFFSPRQGSMGNCLGVDSDICVNSKDHAFSFWYKTASPANQRIAAYSVDTSSGRIDINGTTNTITVESYTEGAWQHTFNTGISVADDLWHQYLLNFTGTAVQLYVDNKLADSTTSNTDPAETFCYKYFGSFDSSAESNGSGLQGTLSAVRVFNRALSSKETTLLFTVGTEDYNNVYSVRLSIDDDVLDNPDNYIYEVSPDGRANWYAVQNRQSREFSDTETGHDLWLRISAIGSGTISLNNSKYGIRKAIKMSYILK